MDARTLVAKRSRWHCCSGLFVVGCVSHGNMQTEMCVNTPLNDASVWRTPQPLVSPQLSVSDLIKASLSPPPPGHISSVAAV